jgi:hypothetical protein
MTFIYVDRLEVKKGGFIAGSFLAAIFITLLFLVMLIFNSISIVSVAPDFLAVLAVGIGFQLLVAIGEELSFRQYLFKAISDKYGFKASAFVTSLGFSFMHLPSLYFLGASFETMLIGMTTIFFAGILLCLLFVYGGLYNAIAFHFIWNFLQYTVYGLGPLDSVLKISRSGNIFLNGGQFGPEASFIGLGVMLLALFSLWMFILSRRTPENQIYM